MADPQGRRDKQFEPHMSHAGPVPFTGLAECQRVPKMTDHISSQEVPLEILYRRFLREEDPEKKSALEKEIEDILETRDEIKSTMHKIAEYSCDSRGPEALTANRPLTQLNLKVMKEVSEHFLRTFSEWHEGQDIGFVLSQEQVFVNLIESGVKIDKIKEAITRAQQDQ